MRLSNKIYELLVFIGLLITCSEQPVEFDILIKDGTVYNGIDTIPQIISIGIKEDKIVFIGNANEIKNSAQKIIDAKGLIVSPGFIDPHTHADRDLKDSATSHNKPFLFQGITTVVVGNDGDSFYPSSTYKKRYKSHGIGTNALLLVGHGTIREQVMGTSDRKATESEISAMQDLIRQEMDAGVFGMSTGLFYAPGSFATTEEVIALAKTVSEYGGIYDTHLRDESSYTVGLIPAIEEVIEIGKQAKLPVHISHIKCLGVDVWKQSDSIITMIEIAQKEGVKVTANQYPYDASATGLKAAVVPRWAESGGKDSLFIRFKNPKLQQQILAETKNNIKRRGGPEKLLIVKAPDSSILNKNVLEISKELNVKPEVAVFKVLEKGYVRVASFNMNQYDIANFMKQPWVVTGSDGNTGHPRKYGSFPRKYNKYVVGEHILNMGDFINKSSSKPAEILKIVKRGKLEIGNYADIIVFNPTTFRDLADYKDAFKLSQGLEYSIINGNLSIEQGEFTGELNGKVLLKK